MDKQYASRSPKRKLFSRPANRHRRLRFETLEMRRLLAYSAADELPTPSASAALPGVQITSLPDYASDGYIRGRVTLLAHVVGLAAADLAEAGGQFEHALRLVDVHMHPDLPMRAGDDQAAAELGQCLPQRPPVDGLSGHHALGAEAVLDLQRARVRPVHYGFHVAPRCSSSRYSVPNSRSQIG